MMHYRPEIDGLRAIAVLGVIFYHANFTLFGSGYLGVDIFFVISGYLITSLIADEIQQGTFTFAQFYERRIRRLFPALWFVTVVTLIAGEIILGTQDLFNLFYSVAATTLYVSNLYFYTTLDYWSADTELIPLIHTWSLAVEEQFYIVFPPLLLLISRFKVILRILMLVIISVVSLVVTFTLIDSNPSLNFYSLHSRAWELLLGSLCAILLQNYHQQLFAAVSERTATFLANLGLLLIILSIVLFDENATHPGVITLIPTLGTGLLILFTQKQSLAYRILTWKPMILTGLISYSAYLWHQPLFAYVKLTATEDSLAITAGLIVITMVMAYLSWRFVEKPFRNRQFLTRSRIFLLAFMGTILLLFFSLMGIIKTDTSQEAALAQHDGFMHYDGTRLMRNFGLSSQCNGVFEINQCQTGDNPSVVIWGDSFAMHIVNAIKSSKPDDVDLLQITKSACASFLNMAPLVTDEGLQAANDCLAFNRSAMDWIIANETIEHVILSSRYDNYLNPLKSVVLSDQSVLSADEQIFLAELTTTIDTLTTAGKSVYVIAPPPSNGRDLGRCVSFSHAMQLSYDRCDYSVSRIAPIRKQAYEVLETIERNGNRVIWLHEMLCPNGKCISHLDTVWLYRDTGHFSINGSVHLGLEYDLYNKIINHRSESVETRN